MSERYVLVRNLYDQQGFVLLPGGLPAPVRRSCLKIAEQADQASAWVRGDESDHAWEELSLEEPFDIAALLLELGLHDLLDQPKRTTQWLNRYSGGQYIPAHRDAAGDAHLLFLVSQPTGVEGGQLWLGSEDHVLPMGEGDVVLFPASKILHGMTPMTLGASGCRMTLNARLWIETR